MSKVQVYSEKYLTLRKVDWDFKESSQDLLSRIHPYPARFINDIPRNLIESLGCPRNSIVVDPFCGSGTTLVEAQRHGLESVGIDLNPIACLISKVKTQYLCEDFAKRVDFVSEAAQHLYEKEVLIPRLPNINHWFEGQIQRAIAALIHVINQEKEESVKDALLLALSSIIVKVSNQESDTRYAAVCKNARADDVFKNFVLAGEKISEAKENGFETKATVILQDILTVSKNQFTRPIGLVITSPPYPNAYEYWLYHKYRMWWLGYNPLDVRTYEIGARPHYQKKNGQTENDFSEQMRKVFLLLISRLVKGGHICIVVGRSIIRGRLVDNSLLIREIGKNCRMKIVADITRQIVSSRKSFNLKYGKINEEHILIFKKEF